MKPNLFNASVPKLDSKSGICSSAEAGCCESSNAKSTRGASFVDSWLNSGSQGSIRRQPATAPSWKAAYVAFVAAVFACLAAAATVANHDLPLILGGL